MRDAGREPSCAQESCISDVETIASNYLLENGGDAHLALRRIIADALADLLEFERRSRRAERLVSRGYARRDFDKRR
jgi:hypothetical protein